MRIISGTLKGRVIQAPTRLPVRPTTDYAKTALFNILEHRYNLEDVIALDLFAGIGSISLELASRGCKQITSVDKEAGCVQFISSVAEKFGLKQLHTIRADVFSYLHRCRQQFDFIFADPPFDKHVKDLPLMIFEKGLLKEHGLFILEHAKEAVYSDHPRFVETKSYGKVHFSFFS